MPEADLLQRLQSAIGDTYRVERELGGGGMSRVFVAEEVELGRRVVIKVLPPDMAAGVNQERFRREIQLAAKLQHPHIVPLLTAGSHDDLLYYVMPYIEGESLRAKLAREGELPVSETLHILREVLDALAHAHAQGVVHRDIKPDNVMLSGKHALVTDFGVAKAVSESTGGSSLTSLGVALGTPAYMSPEQAAANPTVDHRADIYSVGALAYEMLCARPPFGGGNAQAVLAAHVTQAPEPASTYRSTISPALNVLVMRCLEKLPADRWQRADDMLPQLEAMTTPSGGVTPTGTQPVAGMDLQAAARRGHPLRVAALFGAASLAVLAVVYLLVMQLGLPDWVMVGAVALLAVGLPIMLTTGLVERRRAIAHTTGIIVPTPQQGIQRWFTWRRAIMGGGLAFVGLTLVAGVYMAMRLMGIGPVGTLVASGVLEARDPIIVADFENRTADSTLAASITEALRIDLGQSPVLRLVERSEIAGVLNRMERDAGTAVDVELAREIAQREGYKAVVTGEIAPLGAGYVLSARLVSAADGETLVPLRETAEDDGEIIGAVDRLSKKLRERVGESLRSIRASEPLSQVTTTSLEALQKYSQANWESSLEGGSERAIALLQEAIALDSTFAMAYRRLAATLGNVGAPFSQQIEATSKAYDYRERLPPLERHLTTAYYFTNVEFDRPKTIDAYRSALEVKPDEIIALNNLSIELEVLGQWAEAEELALRAIEVADEWQFYANAALSQVAQGKFADANALLDQFAERVPGHPRVAWLRARLAAAQDGYAAAEAQLDTLAGQQRESLVWQWIVASDRAWVAQAQGRLRDAERYLREFMALSERRGQPNSYLSAAARSAYLDVLFRETPDSGLAKLEAALRRHPLSSVDAVDRPYGQYASVYADAGQVERARALVTEYEREVAESTRRGNPFRHLTQVSLALAEGRGEDAARAARAFHDEANGPRNGWFQLGQAHELMGNPDSALVMYERAANEPDLFHLPGNAYNLALAYKRLGELYEERGAGEQAVEYYNRFVDLWSGADDDLQPVVQDVRQRIARLVGER